MTAYDVMRLSASLCHFWQCLWDLGSALAERRDRGRWVGVPKDANSMAVSGLACRKALVGTGRAISVLFGINGLTRRNELFYLVGPPFLAFTAHFSATSGWHFLN